jgi:transcriptional regulator with XRE-family HTH domain
METFAERLQAAMDVAGLSPSDLAANSGLTESAISLLRSGRREPSYRTLQRLAMPRVPSTRLKTRSPTFAPERWSSYSTTRIVKTKAT